MTEQSMNDINAAQDMQLDDIEDLPGFDTPPSGEYVCSVSLAAKTLKDKDYISFDFKLIEVKQLGDQETERTSVVGQQFGVLFRYNEQGLSYMKPYLKQFKEALKTSGSIAEIVEATKDVNVLVMFKYKTSKGKVGTENAGKEYANLNISSLIVL